MLKGSRVLVTGGAGFIGSNLVLRLVEAGARVRATIHSHGEVAHNPTVEYLKVDLTRMEDCQRTVEGVDYIFHCAASTSGAAVMKKTPLVHITPNLVMTSQLMEAAYMAKVKKFLYLSSSAAYPPTGDRPVREEEMFDADPYDIYFGVGWMKRTAEWLAVFYSQKLKDPMPVTVVRPSNIFGPRDKFSPDTSHVTAALIRRVVQREKPFVVWGTGNDIRDLLYIDDFLNGLLMAFNDPSPYLAVNIAAGGEGHTVKDVIRTLLDLDGFHDADVQFDTTKPQMIPVRLIDNSLAVNKLGFQPRYSLREGLEKTIEWYRENQKSWTR
jgi:GDP-L-fucose synthase